MVPLFKRVSFIMLFATLGFAQVSNIQFTTLDGDSYDLYNDLLNKGKPVYVDGMFNG